MPDFSYYVTAVLLGAPQKTYSGLSVMNYKIKAALLGGDMRQSAAARFLSESGLECAVWGMDPGADALALLLLGNAQKLDHIAQFIGIFNVPGRDLVDAFHVHIVQPHPAVEGNGGQDGDFPG